MSSIDIIFKKKLIYWLFHRLKCLCSSIILISHLYLKYNGLYSVHQYEIVKATKLVIRNKLRNRLDIPAEVRLFVYFSHNDQLIRDLLSVFYLIY